MADDETVEVTEEEVEEAPPVKLVVGYLPRTGVKVRVEEEQGKVLGILKTKPKTDADKAAVAKK